MRLLYCFGNRAFGLGVPCDRYRKAALTDETRPERVCGLDSGHTGQSQ